MNEIEALAVNSAPAMSESHKTDRNGLHHSMDGLVAREPLTGRCCELDEFTIDRRNGNPRLLQRQSLDHLDNSFRHRPPHPRVGAPLRCKSCQAVLPVLIHPSLRRSKRYVGLACYRRECSSSLQVRFNQPVPLQFTALNRSCSRYAFSHGAQEYDKERETTTTNNVRNDSAFVVMRPIPRSRDRNAPPFSNYVTYGRDHAMVSSW